MYNRVTEIINYIQWNLWTEQVEQVSDAFVVLKEI